MHPHRFTSNLVIHFCIYLLCCLVCSDEEHLLHQEILQLWVQTNCNKKQVRPEDTAIIHTLQSYKSPWRPCGVFVLVVQLFYLPYSPDQALNSYWSVNINSYFRESQLGKKNWKWSDSFVMKWPVSIDVLHYGRQVALSQLESLQILEDMFGESSNDSSNSQYKENIMYYYISLWSASIL